ncbi:josephin-like protein [Coffea eugenioides]|uniref:josephin-like protein n=1 Tax=Coffea eugenioides TaxID=49369 RepID=UPI000F6058AB|nr:josephin-like protein [Coffea eugenioides]
MSIGNMNKRVGFSPDVNDKQPVIRKQYSNKERSGYRSIKVSGGSKERVHAATQGTWTSFRVPESSSSSGFSAVRFAKRVGANVAQALRFISCRKKCSCKVSSAASLTLARSRSYAETLDDSQRAEAIEDCIEFFNSSSSLQRSNSVASSC